MTRKGVRILFSHGEVQRFNVYFGLLDVRIRKGFQKRTLNTVLIRSCNCKIIPISRYPGSQNSYPGKGSRRQFDSFIQVKDTDYPGYHGKGSRRFLSMTLLEYSKEPLEDWIGIFYPYQIQKCNSAYSAFFRISFFSFFYFFKRSLKK